MAGPVWEPLSKDLQKQVRRRKTDAALMSVVYLAQAVAASLRELEQQNPGVVKEFSEAFSTTMKQMEAACRFPRQMDLFLLVGKITLEGATKDPPKIDMGFLNRVRQG